ncbi:hypothetical protein B0A53_00067 [Rhodotorula sp. CCFEE 5036]|nr:hypothetical protein B0A53_00067 [Rhodotorula sp. CCFEE 5036]
MHAALSVLSLATLASVASAQYLAPVGQGYGRFPCDPNNAASCTNLPDLSALTNNGPASDSYQGTSPAPTGAQCVQEAATGGYFCGIQGAACSSDSNCDNGSCQNGQCVGDFSTACSQNTQCLGYLYCLNVVDLPASGTCGGINAYCQDFILPGLGVSGTALQTQTDYNCQSGFCSSSGYCANKVTTVGGDCSFDMTRGCGAGLTPVSNGATCTCQLATGPSQRARARRSVVQRRAGTCPASHTACSVDGVKGFECIDTTSNIEQCGGCASEGGVDCTSIEGVAAVGCVAGVCEIWSCEDGYSFDADQGLCVPSA